MVERTPSVVVRFSISKRERVATVVVLAVVATVAMAIAMMLELRKTIVCVRVLEMECGCSVWRNLWNAD
jgi:high-affinity Fe2+/Pb2+ permease